MCLLAFEKLNRLIESSWRCGHGRQYPSCSFGNERTLCSAELWCSVEKRAKQQPFSMLFWPSLFDEDNLGTSVRSSFRFAFLINEFNSDRSMVETLNSFNNSSALIGRIPWKKTLKKRLKNVQKKPTEKFNFHCCQGKNLKFSHFLLVDRKGKFVDFCESFSRFFLLESFTFFSRFQCVF